jgi:hypothetical protein
MTKLVVYFETLSLGSLLSGIVKYPFVRKLFGAISLDIYYIESSYFIEKIFIPYLKMRKVKIERLDFKMMDVRDKEEELVRLRIPRKDLFYIQKLILSSEAYKVLRHESWQQDRISNYIANGIIAGGIPDKQSVSRMLYIILVISWYMQNHNHDQSVFVINNRPWFNVYSEYAEQYNIWLCPVSNLESISIKASFERFIRNYYLLYGILKNIKYKQWGIKKDKINASIPSLYLDGRGDINFKKDGEHSDFFWQINSDFPSENIIYKHHSDVEKKYLIQEGVNSVTEGLIFSAARKRNYIKPKINYSRQYKSESKVIQSILASYELDRFYWGSFFNHYGVKLFLFWNKYSNEQIALSDAIGDNGGISINWQMAFDGGGFSGCNVDVDVGFSYSNFSDFINMKQGSKIKYNVITGYPKDYVNSLLKDRAKALREKLMANGARKIVFVIDENSLDDSRWHTGHELQRENYSYILGKVLDTPWLGVVFKPKVAKTLRSRLGPVAELLSIAESTGRCYVYEASGRYTTSAPPVLAGLSADICIHGHLCAGTAALECALEGLPTLLIDREGATFSKLYELPQGKVIFKDWPSTIDAVMKHFNTPDGIPGFGDWSAIIDELDPFRDGKAAYRMGTYLHWLVQGYEQGFDKDTIMANAALEYQKKWGADKVICH